MTRSPSKAAALVALVFAIGACASMARGGAWVNAQKAYGEGDYRGAIQHAEQVLSYGTPTFEDRAKVGLLKARCYEKLSELPEAIALYIFVSKTFPETSYDYEARAALLRLAPDEPVTSGNPL